MSSNIRLGLRIQDDDDESKPAYEHTSLEADRKKGKLQQDLDMMLFGGPPVRGRKPKVQDGSSATKKQETKPEIKKDDNKKPAPIPPGKNDTNQLQPKKPEPSSKDLKPTPKPEQNPPTKFNNYINDSKVVIKPPPPPQPEIEEVIYQPEHHEIQVGPQQIYDVNKQVVYNRPGYIRKLKKIAEDFKFAEENQKNNRFIDVVRPGQTQRSKQRKLNDINFRDFEYPPKSISLGHKFKDLATIWKTPNQINKGAVFGKYIDPNDLKPGSLSSPHFLSTLSVLAELEANTKRLIEDQKVNSNGFYLVRIFVNSVWRYVVVDSLIPFVGDQNLGVISYSDSEFELSSALIEKAYAKCFGGYDVFQKIQPRENYLRDLTGAPVRKYAITDPSLAAIVKKATSQGQPVIAVPNPNITELALNPNYSLNLISVTSKNNLQLRNSWGTLQERSKLPSSKEGAFELTSTQAKNYISHIQIAHTNINYFTTTVQSKHKYGFYSSYNFKIQSQAHGFLSISQWDQRLFPTGNYEYSPFRIVIHKIGPDGNCIFVNAGFSSNSRNLDVEVNLTPGQYTVFCSGQWKAKEFDYNLTFYGSESVDFERVHTQKFPNLIVNSLQKLAVDQGVKSVQSATNQYTFYHEASNLVVLTAQNNSDRQIIALQDLTKVNLDKFVLLNSRSGELYANLISEQIEALKNQSYENKRWEVTLGGKERYTWVLAAGESFDLNTLKKIGFKL